MSTLLSGRYIAIEMMPLSFKEYYCAVSGGSTDYFKYYQDYLRYSSFPFAIELNKDIEKINSYLSAIVDSIILKDVIKRKK